MSEQPDPMAGPCTCGHIKPYGTGPHVCIGDEPADEEETESESPRPRAHSLNDCWCGEPHRREDFL